MDQWTIESLVARYTLEPTTRYDVYVEGVRDADLLNWFFRECEAKHRRAVPIELVCVPSAVIASCKVPSGSNRWRVVALAIELEARGVDVGSVRFAIDRDLDDLVPPPVDYPKAVLRTDLGTIEMYALHDHFASKLVAAMRVDISTGALIGAVSEVLRLVYALRAAVQLAGLGIALPAIDRELFLDNSLPAIDLDKLVAKVDARLRAEDRDLLRASLRAALAAARSLPSGIAARGGDLVVILQWLLRKHGDQRVTEESVRRDLFFCLSPGLLLRHRFFALLVNE